MSKVLRYVLWRIYTLYKTLIFVTGRQAILKIGNNPHILLESTLIL